jgi:hypothetical protein
MSLMIASRMASSSAATACRCAGVVVDPRADKAADWAAVSWVTMSDSAVVGQHQTRADRVGRTGIGIDPLSVACSVIAVDVPMGSSVGLLNPPARCELTLCVGKCRGRPVDGTGAFFVRRVEGDAHHRASSISMSSVRSATWKKRAFASYAR